MGGSTIENHYAFGQCQEKRKYSNGSGMGRGRTPITGPRCGANLPQQQVYGGLSGVCQMPGESR